MTQALYAHMNNKIIKNKKIFKKQSILSGEDLHFATLACLRMTREAMLAFEITQS
jgi:hypothetical protein